MDRWLAAVSTTGFITKGNVLKYFTEGISVYPNCIHLDSFTQA
jgi:hypothetical protein